MATPKFTIGDTVNLKSNKNVKMSVNEIINESNFTGDYKCIWFDCTFDLRRDDFKEDTLEKSIKDTN